MVSRTPAAPCALRLVPLALCLVPLLALASCSSPPIEALKLDGNRLTVNNRTPQAWTDVEIWLNNYYRVTTSSIAAGQRFDAPLDAFVEGWGRHFDFHRAQIKDLRLSAMLPDGRRLELKKEFIAPGLAGALGGTR